MLSNLPVWGYYHPQDEYFVDPLYTPYDNSLYPSCEVNPAKKLPGYSTGFVNPQLVRRGKGLGFQLAHPTDPCPHGWKKNDGWCVPTEPEFGDNGLYSDRAFVPKFQYWNGYAPRNTEIPRINEFDTRSVSPYTGRMVSQPRSSHSPLRQKYGQLRSSDSFLV